MTNIIKPSDYKNRVKDVINTGKEKNLKIVFRDRTTNSGDFTKLSSERYIIFSVVYE